MTVYRAGATEDRVDLRQFRAEIERLMLKYYGASLESISDPEALIEVIQAASKYNINIPTEFALLARALGLVEGIIRSLLPEVDIVEEVHPWAVKLMKRRFSLERITSDMSRMAVQLQGHARELPTQFSQVLMDLESGRISIQVVNPEAKLLRDEIRMGVVRLSLAMLASTVTLGAILLLAAWSPTLWGLPVFGALGLILALAGTALFAALGLHVFFSRFIDLENWKRRFLAIVRFFSWRRN